MHLRKLPNHVPMHGDEGLETAVFPHVAGSMAHDLLTS